MGMLDLVEFAVIGIVLGTIWILRRIVELDRRQTARDAQIRSDIAGLQKTIGALGELVIGNEEARQAEAKELRLLLKSVEGHVETLGYSLNY